MDQKEEAKCLGILTYHRELLVSRLRSIQCILDNLLVCGFLCEEDVEIVQRTVTKTDQVGKAKTSVEQGRFQLFRFHIYKKNLNYMLISLCKISPGCEIIPNTFFPVIILRCAKSWS